MADANDLLIDSITPMGDVAPLARIMLYGNPGSGKTVLGMRIAQVLRGDKKVLYVDSARGFTTLQVNERWQHLREGVGRMEYQNRSQLLALAAAFASGDPRFDEYSVVVLDELNTMAERDVTTVSQYRTKDSSRSDPNEITWPDRNISYNRIKEMVTLLQARPLHLIYLAHARTVKDHVGISRVAPAFGPQQIDPILAPLQLVGYCEAAVENGQRFLRVQCQELPRVTAKSQFDRLGLYASFDQVLDAVSAFSQGTISPTPDRVDTLTENDLRINDLS